MTEFDRTGSDYVLSALASEGVSDLFGLIGEGNAHLLDATTDHPIAFRSARHEQVAVMMADGYARATGTVGVCTLTHGPGVTHGATGIACADRDNVPLVVLIGDTNFEGRETSLQYLDHGSFTAPISLYQTRIETTAVLRDRLRRAFDTARMERGPVVVELPGDIQAAAAPDDPYRPVPRADNRVRPDPNRVREAVDRLEAAEAPVLLAGGGAARAGAGKSLERLAERVGAPIVTTFFGRGVLPDSHPLMAGIAGTFLTPASEAVFETADLVVAAGAQLAGKSTRYGALYEDIEIVQIDIDQAAMATHLDPDIEIVGDAHTTLGAIADRVAPAPDRETAVRDLLEESPAPRELPFETSPNLIDPRELTVAISDMVSDDAIITVDSGNNTGFPPVFHRIDGDGRMFVNGNFGSMGWAFPAALGAKQAMPHRQVVCYIGDGAFLQVIQDIETGVRLELPALVVVYNDESYGIIRHRQELEFDRTTASEYESVGFAAIARGFGAEATAVRSAEDLEAVRSYLAGDPTVPMVVDARTIPSVARPGFPPY